MLSKAHLSRHLNVALCKVKSVNYVKLFAGVDTPVDASSSYRPIQRFMALADLSMI